MMINICGPRDPQPDSINTTSISKDWGRGFSPFFLGPVDLYWGYNSVNVENAWQFCKVYRHQIDEYGDPSLDYWKWAVTGWSSHKAHRYPMGKGAMCEYSYWAGQKLSYVEARKQIYVPLYSSAVAKTSAFAHLQQVAQEQDVWLWDFDGYDYRSLGMTLKDVINCPFRKMGHAFVLAMMLEGVLQECLKD